MTALQSPLVLVGVAQTVALAGIFVRLGRVMEKSEENRQKIDAVKAKVENHH